MGTILSHEPKKKQKARSVQSVIWLRPRANAPYRVRREIMRASKPVDVTARYEPVVQD